MLNEIALTLTSNRLPEVIRLVRCHFPTITPSTVIQSTRSEQAVIVIAIDYTSPLEPISRLLELCRELDSHQFPYRLFLRRIVQHVDSHDSAAVEETISLDVIQRIYDDKLFEANRPVSALVHEYLAQLTKSDWFINTGKPLAEKNVVAVHSLAEVTRRENHWADILQEVQNLLTETLCYEHPQRYHGRWNFFAEQIVNLTRVLVEEKLVNAPQELRESSKQSLEYLIAVACLELQYADCVRPRFAKHWADWLLHGRMPCDWQGNFDGVGKLAVY